MSEATAPQADGDLMIQLGQFAHRVPASAIPNLGTQSRFGHRRSKFWFKLQTLDQQLSAMKAATKKPEREHLDADVQNRLKTYKQELPDQLRANIEQVREFFLRDISPLTLATSPGASQSAEVIKQMTDSEVDPTTIFKFKQLMGRALTIKMAKFALSYFELGPEFLSELLYGQKKDDGFEELRAMVQQLIAQQSNQGPNTPEGSK